MKAHEVSHTSLRRYPHGPSLLDLRYHHGDLADTLQAFYLARAELRSENRDQHIEYLKEIGKYKEEFEVYSYESEERARAAEEVPQYTQPSQDLQERFARLMEVAERIRSLERFRDVMETGRA